MRFYKYALHTVVATALFVACQKKDNTTPDPAKVNMTIETPSPGQTFVSGDTVYIKGKVIYPGELHGYEVQIVDTSSGFILFDKAYHLHADNFVFNEQWVCNTTTPETIKLIVTAAIDHDGDNATSQMFLRIKP